MQSSEVLKNESKSLRINPIIYLNFFFTIFTLVFSSNLTFGGEFSENVTQIVKGPIILKKSTLFYDKLKEQPQYIKESEFKFREQNEFLNKIEVKKNKVDAKAIKEWLLSFHFQNRIDIFNDNLNSEKSFPIPSDIYNKNGEYPFDGYLNARSSLFNTSIDKLNIREFNNVHYKLLSKTSFQNQKKGPFRNSENTPEDRLGQIRSIQIHYTAPQYPIDNRKYKLTDGTTLKFFDSLPELVRHNPFIKVETVSENKKYINYLPPELWERKEISGRLSKELNKQIKDYISNKKDLYELNQNVITELINAILEELRLKLKSAVTKIDVINAVAEFQYKFISIHPYANGNGRLSRLITERILNEYNIPSPIWIHHDQDVELPLDEFKRLMIDSINLSDNFYEHLNTLTDAHIDIDAVSIPFIFSQTEFESIKKELGIKNPIILEEFMTWIYSNKNLKLSGIREALQEFDKWKKKFANDGPKHPNEGISLAPPSFICCYNKISCNDCEYKHKIDSFYNSDEYVYRGAGVEGHPSNASIVRSFVLPTGALIGNGLSDSLSKQEIDQEWRNYNLRLNRNPDGLNDTLIDHLKERGSYSDSKMISTSREKYLAYQFSRRTYGKSNKENSGILYSMLSRKVGTIDTRNSIWKSPYQDENEVTYLIGNEPEALVDIRVEDYDRNQNFLGVRSFRRINRLEILMTRYDENNHPVDEFMYHIDPSSGRVREERLMVNRRSLPAVSDLSKCPFFEFRYLDFIKDVVNKVDNRNISDEEDDFSKLTTKPIVEQDILTNVQKLVLSELISKGYEKNDYLVNGIKKINNKLHFETLKILSEGGYQLDFEKILNLNNPNQLKALSLFVNAKYRNNTAEDKKNKFFNFDLSYLYSIDKSLHVDAIKLYTNLNLPVDCEHISKNIKNPYQIDGLKMLLNQNIISNESKEDLPLTIGYIQNDQHLKAIKLLTDASYDVDLKKVSRISNDFQLEALQMILKNRIHDEESDHSFDLNKIRNISNQNQIQAIKLYNDAGIQPNYDKIVKSISNPTQIEAIKIVLEHNKGKKNKVDTDPTFFEKISSDFHLFAINSLLRYSYFLDLKKIGNLTNIHQVDALKLLMVYGQYDNDIRQFLDLDYLQNISNVNQVHAINALLNNGYKVEIANVTNFIKSAKGLQNLKLLIQNKNGETKDSLTKRFKWAELKRMNESEFDNLPLLKFDKELNAEALYI